MYKDYGIHSVAGPFGKCLGHTNFIFEGFIIGLHGRAGKHLNNLGVYSFPIAKRGPLWGSADAPYEFDGNPDIFYPAPVVKVEKLFIRHMDNITGLQGEYRVVGGGVYRDNNGGNYGNNFSNIYHTWL